MVLLISADFIFGGEFFFMHSLLVNVHYLSLGCSLLKIMCSFAASFYVKLKSNL